MNQRRLEWGNRLILEQYNNPVRPFFVTLTYRPDVLPKNNTEVLRLVQLYIKRLRKHVDVRYFLVTELGSRNGRVHNHMVLWSKKLSKMDIISQWRLQYDVWSLGRLESQPIRGIGGLKYVAKYVTKNYTKKLNETTRMSGDEAIDAGRLYTWSQKPMLGSNGINRWKYLTEMSMRSKESLLVHQDNGIVKIKDRLLLANWFNAIIFGKMERLYIPVDVYKRHVKDLYERQLTTELAQIEVEDLRWLDLPVRERKTIERYLLNQDQPY